MYNYVSFWFLFEGSGNFTAEKSTHVIKKWTAGDTFRIQNIENDKFPASKLHLYLLNGSSTFFAMLISIWKAYLLVS